MPDNNDPSPAALPLTPEKRAQFDSQGFLLASGLISPDIVIDAVAAIREWTRERPGASFFRTAAANACYTHAVCAAASQLAESGDPDRTYAPFYPVNGALAIITYPGPGDWVMPGPHIDHALREDGHRSFPPPYRLASLLYLTEVPPHGGGTVVWPGSHRKIERIARADSARGAAMADLNESLAEAALGEPVELTPHAGDILFYHYLLAHAGSRNTSARPRIALNHKW